MYQIDFRTPIHIHFIGIGGISMSGLAELLLAKGFSVSGSDAKASALTDELAKKGAVIHIGQCAANLSPAPALVVYTAAIHADNPEFAAAKEAGLPMLTRAQLLGQIMKCYSTPIAVSGTHGKTTTTSMISSILLHADTDPTISIGGILKENHSNFRIGHSDIFLTEACEYTNSFLSFFPRIGIILNVEEDHMDFFHNIEEIRDSFHRFASLLPADGVLIIHASIPGYEELVRDLSCKVVTFGSTETCDYSYRALSYDEYGCASYTLVRKDQDALPIALKVPGEHNVLNSLAALALAGVLGISDETAVRALFDFTGTSRRFEYKGNMNGVTIIDDYAHHPTEITATLRAAKHYPHKRIWCVFQPHTYTRTKTFLKEFARALSLADHVVLADIYAARETDTLGISSQTLQTELQALHVPCDCPGDFSQIVSFIRENCINGDLLITMGAGDVVNIGEMLLKD
ncbi:MAG: UDP-N-acetylmuramate--L-alanine ligase [Clostridium sp.]|nr:UDP-N-acetylmuramate--L-alanine ligase [Clostridium sp.]